MSEKNLLEARLNSYKIDTEEPEGMMTAITKSCANKSCEKVSGATSRTATTTGADPPLAKLVGTTFWNCSHHALGFLSVNFVAVQPGL